MQQARTVFHRKKLERLEIKGSIQVILLQSITYHYTGLMNKRQFILCFFSTSVYAQIKIRSHGMGSEHFILPVRTGISLINIMLVGMTIFIVEVSRIGTFLTGIFILHQYKFIRVHHVQFIGECFSLYICIQADGHTSLCRILGRYQNNAISTAGAVNSGRSSILQYLDRLYIRRRNIIQATYFEPVKNNQRTVVLRNRATATHQNLNFRIR